MKRKTVLLIGSQPERMIRLRKTFASLKKMDADVRVLVPYRNPSGRPRIVKGIVRYILLTLQLAISKADIYHFFNVPDITGIPLIWKRGVLIYDVRSPWFSSIKESLGNNFLSRIAGFIEWVMTKGADIVIGANTPIALRAQKWGAKDIGVIPNYPTPDFAPHHTRTEIRDLLHLGTKPTVLYVGKISKIEGSELLKKIISEVVKGLHTVQFLIVGDGPEKRALEKFVNQHNCAKNVLFVNWVPHKEVADYILASDICLLPREWSSFSPYTTQENITKAAEYLAIGKPVIAPKMGGFATATFPVIAVEPTEMGEAVLDFLRNPRDIGEYERPSWEISHKRLKKLYSRLGAVDAD